MRAYVFPDAALAKHAGQFVWLAMDTDQQQTAPFQAKFPIDAWPTLLVIDSATEQPVLKWLGSADVHELEKLLEDAQAALRAHPPAPSSDPDRLLAQADRLFAQNQGAAAIAAYRAALAAAPRDWAHLGRAAASLLDTLQMAGDDQQCAKEAAQLMARVPPDVAYVDVVTTGLQCGLDGDEKAPWRAEALARFLPASEKALEIPGLLADDRSGIYEVLVQAHQAAHDVPGAKAVARAWLGFLEAEASKATNPQSRSVFDAHRAEAAIALGDPARAIPPLQASERDLPDDYNAPARLAVVYLAMNKLPEALAANDRALSRVYGPRTLRVLEQRASIFSKMGQPARAHASLDQALALAQKLPAGQRSQKSISAIQAKLAELK